MKESEDLVCSFDGVGLHTGAPCRVTLRQTPDGAGIVMKRIDRPNRPTVRITDATVEETTRRTVLSCGDVSISTTEHILAALIGLGHRNATLELEGPELPILDGSALPYAQALSQWSCNSTFSPLEITETLVVRSGDSSAVAKPSSSFSMEVEVVFEHKSIGRQRIGWDGSSRCFLSDFAPARTFGFVEEIPELLSQGLASGGSLDCALVFGPDEPINSLRFPDEPVRHKLVDALGDLALLGRPILAEIELVRPGHTLMHCFLEELRKRSRR